MLKVKDRVQSVSNPHANASLENLLIYKRKRGEQVQDLVKWGAPGSDPESCRCSEVESREQSKQFVAKVQGPPKGPGSFWVFNAQICTISVIHTKLNEKMAFPA